MDEAMIKNHNELVGRNDTTIHAGDFTFYKGKKAYEIIKQLNGHNIFLNGSHDYWLKGKKDVHEIWERNCFLEETKERYHIVVCHYCLRTWARSHFNSWHLYGHSHGTLPSEGKSHDIGVDNNNFKPLSLESIVEIMKDKPDNFNLVKK